MYIHWFSLFLVRGIIFIFSITTPKGYHTIQKNLILQVKLKIERQLTRIGLPIIREKKAGKKTPAFFFYLKPRNTYFFFISERKESQDFTLDFFLRFS